jgi:2-polyprenyl-3-methyl-5-hydroxy-6-metoxy-1,4-benzoquinol methylase
LELRNLYGPLPNDPEAVLKIAEYNQLYTVIAVACHVKLFEILRQKQSASHLAEKNGWDESTTVRLLDVLYLLGYLKKDNDAYQNSAIAEDFLLPGESLYLGHHFSPAFPPGSLGFQIMKCLEKSPGYIESPEPDWNPERLRQIGVSSLNGSIQSTVGSIDLSNARKLLDLGGGHGFYSIALAQKYPALSVTLFDLPQIIALAREYLHTFQLTDQVQFVPGNFLQGDIGTGYDAVLCANILHSTKRSIVLDKVWQALNSDGQIIVKCRIADCVATLSTALAKLIWQVRGGKELFSQNDWHQVLTYHGFKDIKTLNFHGIFATIVGVKK